jgi:hypothetical protein
MFCWHPLAHWPPPGLRQCSRARGPMSRVRRPLRGVFGVRQGRVCFFAATGSLWCRASGAALQLAELRGSGQNGIGPNKPLQM